LCAGHCSDAEDKRERAARTYAKKLRDVDEVELPYISPDVKISWFVYVIRLRKNFGRKQRDRILNELCKKGIGCSNYFSPIHLQPFYKKMFGYKEGDFPVTESVSDRTIALPFYTNLKEKDIDNVVRSLKQGIARVKRHDFPK
jgi:perosamine synthetase